MNVLCNKDFCAYLHNLILTDGFSVGRKASYGPEAVRTTSAAVVATACSGLASTSSRQRAKA